MPIATTTGTAKLHGKEAVRIGVQESPFVTATATAGAATANGGQGQITSEALTTAAGADYTLTLTNSVVAAADIVFGSVQSGTNTQGDLTLGAITPAAGSVTIVVRNMHATQALNGTIVVSFEVVKKSAAPL